MERKIVFTGKDKCELQEFAAEEISAQQVRIKTRFSLISTGTETIVLGRKFDPGTSWDKWVRYPFASGYASIGEVVEIGSDVQNLKKGDIIVSRRGHSSAHVIDERDCYPVPAGIEPELAVWFALAKISFMGVHAAQVRLGDSVLVIGGGPIGQMAVRWAVAGGAERVVLVDLLESRLALGRAGGASCVIGKPLDSAEQEIREAFGGKEPGIVIDSTGNAQVFSQALRIAAARGTVVILGDTGTPAQQVLTGDVINRGLKIIGAHDCHSGGDWPESRIVGLYFSLLQSGRISMAEMNTHAFKPEDVKKAYQTAENERGSTMGMLFDWR